MSRYYFDFRDNDDLMFDDVGVELADLDAAHREGFRGLMAVASEAVFALASKRHLTMEVRDENGLVIELSAAIQSRLLR
jgi:hypothetical protein